MHISQLGHLPGAQFQVIIDTLAYMYQTGNSCPLVLLLGRNELPVNKVLEVSPDTKIVLRIYRDDANDPLLPFDRYYNMIVSEDPTRKKAHWHQQVNEYNVFTRDAIAWELQQFELAEAVGARRTYLDKAVGNPGEEDGMFLAYWTRDDVHNLMRRANNPLYVGDRPHLLNLHQYDRGPVDTCDWTGENDIMRWEKKIIPLLPPDLQAKRPLYAHTEFGQQRSRFLPLPVLLQKMRNAQAILQEDDQCVGGAVWLFNFSGQDWIGDDIIYDDLSRLQVMPQVYAA